jgi:hypothetical protein
MDEELPPADMTFTLDEVDEINRHEAREMVEAAREAGVALPMGTAMENVAEAAPGVTATTEGMGNILAPAGMVLGGIELAEGIRDNDGTQAVGGALSTTAGIAGTAAGAVSLAGGSAPALAAAAPVLSAGAAGYGVGRAIDNWSGWAAGQMGVQRGVTTRGLDGGTNMVRDDRNVSDRIGEAAASNSVMRDVGLAAAEHLPIMFGGDRTNEQMLDQAIHPYLPGTPHDPVQYAATDRLVDRTAGGISDAWHSVTGLFD